MEESRPPVALAPERLLQAFALALLLLSAAAQLLVPAAPADPVDMPGPRAELEIQARYILGLSHLTDRFDQDASQVDAAFEGLIDSAEQPLDRLRLTPLALALDKPARAARLVDEARERVASAQLVPFDQLIAGSEITMGRAELAATHGYFGELAAALAEDELEEQKEKALGLAIVLIAAMVVGLGVLLVGSVLAVLAYLRWRAGTLVSGYRRDLAAAGWGDLRDPHSMLAADSGSQSLEEAPMGARRAVDPRRIPFLETIIIAVLGLQVLGVFVALGMSHPAAGRWPLLINWLLLPLLLWPLLRGLDRRAFLPAIGWTRGRGFFVEMGCGFLGYLTAAPLLFLGFLFSALLARGMDKPPHHPILDWVRGAESMDLVLIASLAVLWAPIVEESLFRGSFFHYLRARWGPLASAFAISVAFAALHPQGLAGLPFLFSLAMTLALIREWRGSLIAPITVHLLHNGLVMALLLSLL